MDDANAGGSTTTEKTKEKVKLVKKEMTGTVKFFNRILGWGFIIQDVDQPDAFVHYSWIVSDKKYKNIDDHDFVIYDLYKVRRNGDEEDKFQARNVRKIPETLM